MEKAKGAPATRSEIRILGERLLCTWDPAHRLELVANDIRIDKLGVDVELMSAQRYAQIPKDFTAMYVCCSYDKHCEELVQTAKHLGKSLYAMVKFRETKFAQPELLV